MTCPSVPALETVRIVLNRDEDVRRRRFHVECRSQLSNSGGLSRRTIDSFDFAVQYFVVKLTMVWSRAIEHIFSNLDAQDSRTGMPYRFMVLSSYVGFDGAVQITYPATP